MNPFSTKPTYLNYRTNGPAPASHFRPSGPAPAAAPAPVSLPTSASMPLVGPGYTPTSLLLYVPLAATPSLSTHLNTILRSYRIKEVILLGAREDVLKGLRTEVYTAAGRLRQDIGVTMKIAGSDDGFEVAVKSVVKAGLVGVLVCEGETEAEQGFSGDVLELDGRELEEVWRRSVLPLHALLRHTLPFLSTMISATDSTQPFFYTDTTAAESASAASPSISSPISMAQTLRQTFLSTATSSPLAKNITIGPASSHLKPLSETQSVRSLHVDTNTNNDGHHHANGNGYGNGTRSNGNGNWEVYGQDSSPLAPESPTKLWASWAMQNDF